MFSLAPNINSSGRANSCSITVSATAISKSSVTELPSVFSADSLSPLPRYIDAREAEPMLTSAANADITIISGRHTPMPVSASLPVPSMCPMYMRSTRL